MKLKSKFIPVITALLLVFAMMPQMEAPAYADATGVDFSSYVNTTTTVKFNGIDWYIIGDSTNGVRPEEGTVTLLSKQYTGAERFNRSTSDNVYKTSLIKKGLDVDFSKYYKDVSPAVKSVDLTDVEVTGANLWLLSREEAEILTNAVLHCENDTGHTIMDEGWWLRTPYSDEKYAFLVLDASDEVPDILPTRISNPNAVRPALKLDLRYVDYDNGTKSFTLIKNLPTGNVTVVNGKGSDSYQAGNMVTITANEPPAGKQFSKWKCADGLLFTSGSEETPTATFIMPVHDVDLEATYKAVSDHKHDNIEFVKWTDEIAAEQYGDSEKKANNSLPKEEGDYYLAQDVDLGSSSWNVPAGTTNLCLNGHNITSTEDDDGTVVLKNSYSTLNLYDEHTGEFTGVISSEEENGVLLAQKKTTFNMYGGKISNCDDDGVSLDESGAVFNIYNGEISNCYYGVAVGSDATFTLHNGNIKGNKSYGVNSYGTVIIENGSITNNKTGIKTSPSTKQIILQGSNISPVITDNTEHNLLLDRNNDLKIRVNEGTTISGETNIGVYPTKNASVVPGVFTDGLAGKIQGDKTAADIFKSDDSGDFVSTAESGEALLEKNEQPAVDPVGCIDAVKGKEGSIDVAGWAFDPSDTSQSIDVKVYIGGEAGTAGAEDHTIKADKERADVDEAKQCGKYHGFSDTITTKKRGEQPVYIYAKNIGEGKDVLLVSRPVTISDPKPTPDPKVQKGADEAATENAITQLRGEKDPAGSLYGVLQARSLKQTKTSVKLIWKKTGKAKKYVVYGTVCGKKNKPQKIAEITGASYNVKAIAGKKLNKGTYYKFTVVALDKNSRVVSISKMVHVATKGGKVCNHKTVKTKAKKNKVLLKKGERFKLKAKAIPKSKKKKVKIHRKTSYESSNPNVAAVSAKGVITAKAKGKCVVYAYAQNGVAKTIKVTVSQ